MKQSIILIIVVALLGSCIGSPAIPVPRDQDSSLVIGSLIVDFPDGYFYLPRQTFSNGVRMQILDVTTNKTHYLRTAQGGYFYFHPEAGHNYLVKSFELGEMTTAEGKVTWGETPLGGTLLGNLIAPTPHKIIYLGHAKLTYTLPDRTGFDRTGEGMTTYWSYKGFSSVKWSRYDVTQFLTEQQKVNLWASYDIVDYGKR